MATVSYDTVEGTPKSGRARTIDLDEDTVKSLRSHRRAPLEERMAWGEAWPDSGLVFTREDGTPLHPPTALWHLRRLPPAPGVPHVRPPHPCHPPAPPGLPAAHARRTAARG